ncbi:uncharacterized protein G2W53_007656 [Senna tora]|uniref:Uncharacterized protein n=1 Tax=Senna tora TaxID=362788 RepID=A0A835CEF6_9FABA|nr:uncharacterized protein G2W53_007656 [Senna tora]
MKINKKKGTCDVERRCYGEGETTATVERPSRQQRYKNEEG